MVDSINRARGGQIPNTARMETLDAVRYFDKQADGCERDGSPLYATLSRACARDVERGGPVAKLLERWSGNPLLDAVAMRLFGAVHRLVLNGELPELASHYPSMGGKPKSPQLEEAFLAAVASEADRILPELENQVQTNEVCRSGVLLGGFLEIAANTGLPLRMLELGASAGLNQIWDQYRYRLGNHVWGAGDATPLLETSWSGPPPKLDAKLVVAERAACDLFPIDLRQPGAEFRLGSFVWPDQPERRQRFVQAAQRVRDSGIEIDASRALPWLETKLAAPSQGLATVVFHSIFWHYMTREDQRGIEALLVEKGAAAKPTAPLAWLRMEARSLDVCELRLLLWSGNGSREDRVLADCGFHGQFVNWREG